ncbi:MAG TPA: 8-amino-7-oxononanoate synthase [Sphingomicrobium sp.]|nr:8-amino-7-oxononanoate synthase [Sphingomicrobium sp.]
MAVLEAQARDLEMLKGMDRLRRLIPRDGFDFSSNDYLGLAASDELRDDVELALARGVPVGSGGSRLLRGNQEEHEALEAEAPAFFGCEASLFFSSGFAANATLLSTLPQSGDRIFVDELIHASCHEGVKLSRATAERVHHNNAQAFAEAIDRWRQGGGSGRAWIVVESLYSMDGDRAPLADLLQIAERNDGVLIIDEAHATGVFGPQGRGLAAPYEGLEHVITVRTCGKALGCEGALVCGARLVRDFLINRGRGFIFSTAPSPLMAAAVRASLRLIGLEDRRERLHQLMAYGQEKLAPLGATKSGSQILPVIVGADRETMRLAARIQAAGFDVRGIRPPTVPQGTSRLRISLTLNIDKAAIDALCVAIRDARR